MSEKLEGIMQKIQSGTASKEDIAEGFEELQRLQEAQSPARLFSLIRSMAEVPNRGPHPLTGKKVMSTYGQELEVEGWFEQIFGVPFIFHLLDRPPIILYFCRVMERQVPCDNDVVCVKTISKFGPATSGLLHDSELTSVVR